MPSTGASRACARQAGRSRPAGSPRAFSRLRAVAWRWCRSPRRSRPCPARATPPARRRAGPVQLQAGQTRRCPHPAQRAPGQAVRRERTQGPLRNAHLHLDSHTDFRNAGVSIDVHDQGTCVRRIVSFTRSRGLSGSGSTPLPSPSSSRRCARGATAPSRPATFIGSGSTGPSRRRSSSPARGSTC